jgi:hypothetical protein
LYQTPDFRGENSLKPTASGPASATTPSTPKAQSQRESGEAPSAAAQSSVAPKTAGPSAPAAKPA